MGYDVLHEYPKILVGGCHMNSLFNQYDAYKGFAVYHSFGVFEKGISNRINSKLPLKIFGCTAYEHIPKMLRPKLDPRVEKCVFVGYTPNKKGYKCFNPLTKRFT